MSDITPSYIRGFIAPFKFTSDNYWSAESSVTQNGSYAGVSIPSEGADLQILTVGEQDRTVEIKTTRAGHVIDGAGFVWRYEGDNRFYGMETPNKITNVQNLVVTTTDANIPRDAVRLSSGVIIVAYENISTLDVRARVARIDVNGSISTAAIKTQSVLDLNGNRTYPALCELSDGSVLCAVWVIDGIAAVANINIYRSTDEGKTWVQVSSRALSEDVDIAGAYGAGASGYKLQPIAISSNTHQVLMFTALYMHNTSSTYGSIIKQYVSLNGGLNYSFVDDSTSQPNQFYLPRLVEHNGVFIISYISSGDTISFTHLRDASSSVFTQLALIPAETLAGTYVIATGVNNRLEGGDYTMYADTDGRLYLYAMNIQKTIIYGAYSELMNTSVEVYAAEWYYWNNQTFFQNTTVSKFYSTSSGGGVQNIVGIAGQGEQLLFINYYNLGANSYDDSLTMLTLGGWTSQQYPRLTPYPNDNQWGYDTQTWIPFDKPNQNSVWSRAAVGTVTEALVGDHMTVSAAGTNWVYYYRTPADKSNGVMMHTRISNVSGGSSSTGTCIGVKIQNVASTNTYWVEVIVQATAIYLRDAHAGTQLAAATGLSLPDGVQLLMHVDNDAGSVIVYYADAGSPKQYLSLSGNLTLDAATTQQIYWGMRTGTNLRSADFHFVSYGIGSANGLRFIQNDLNARKYTAQGYFTTVKDGLQISTASGAARENDTYTIEPQYGAPVQRILHSVSPSPVIGWQSDAVSDPDVTAVTAQRISWMMDTTLQGTADTHTQSDAVGIHLTGINFAEWSIDKYVSGSWVKVATVRNTVAGTQSDGSFNFTRSGASITCTDANNVYLHLNECADWSILLDDGAGNVVCRRVVSNGDGVFAATSSKRAYLTLKGIKSSDPTTGTAKLIPDACTAIIPENTFAGLRITAAAQKTAEGYFQIGTMVIGHVVITSPQYGRGRTVEFSANVVETELNNGTVYTSKQGRGGRIVRVAWTDGIDTSALFANPAAPNHYNLFTSTPIAVQGSAPTGMMGLIDYLDGSRDAVVYLPALQTLPSTFITLNRYHEHMLCTLGTSMQIDHVIGDELRADSVGEVFRVASINLREVR